MLKSTEASVVDASNLKYTPLSTFRECRLACGAPALVDPGQSISQGNAGSFAHEPLEQLTTLFREHVESALGGMACCCNAIALIVEEIGDFPLPGTPGYWNLDLNQVLRIDGGVADSC